MRTKGDLVQYQIRGARFVLNKRYCALFVDMGLGKTIMVLTAIAKLLRTHRIERVMIVAPLRVVYNVWIQEARLWLHTRGIKFSIVHGTHQQKVKALQKPAHIYLMNVDNLRWLDDVFGKKTPLPFDMLVVDESSMFKKVKTVRFGIMRRRTREFKRRVIMSGTPTPNGLHEVWPQMFIVDRGLHLGRRYTDFKKEYFDAGGYLGKRLIPKEGAVESITEASSPVVMRLDAGDYLKLPALVSPPPIFVDLPPDALEVYRTLETEMFVAFEETGTFVDNPHAASLRNRCAQIAGGAVYAEHEDTHARVWQPIHHAKMDAVVELVDELQGEPPIIPYRFRHEAIRLKRKYPDYRLIGRDAAGRKPSEKEIVRIIEQWNRGEIEGIIAHPASIGHGLNMQHGGRHFIWFGPLESYEQYIQTLKRLHRRGTARTVFSYMILARNTVDEVIYSDLMAKHRGQTAVNDAYRDRTFRRYMDARLHDRQWLVMNPNSGLYEPTLRAA